MRTIFLCAQRELKRHKGRAFGNIFGYFVTIGFMVVLGHLFLYSDLATKAIMEGTGTHFMAFVPAKTDDATNPAPRIDDRMTAVKVPIDFRSEGFLANTIPTRVFSLDLLAELKRHPDLIRDASPYLMFRLAEQGTGNPLTIGGFDPANQQAVGSTCCARGDLRSGEFLVPGDSGAVMLEEGFALGRQRKVGDTISLGGEMFRVKGIINPGVRPAKVDVYLPFPDAERIINRRLRTPLKNEMNVVLVEVAGAPKQDAAIGKVRDLLKSGIVTSYACYKPASEVLGINRRTVLLISIFIGVAVVLFSMKSQYASVIERRRDFGILKAVGWSDAVIFKQVMMESFLQGAVGGLCGCVAGLAAIFLLPVQAMTGQQVAPFVSLPMLALGLLVAMAAGLAAGLFPAWGAVRRRPAECLRQL